VITEKGKNVNLKKGHDRTTVGKTRIPPTGTIIGRSISFAVHIHSLPPVLPAPAAISSSP